MKGMCQEKQPISVVIVEDEWICRAGLCAELGKHHDQFRILAEAADGKTAISTILHHRPDVVLMDIDLPDMSGFDIIQALRRNHYHTSAFVIITAHDSIEQNLVAIGAGAVAMYGKTDSADRLIHTIQQANHGKYIFAKQVFEKKENLMKWREERILSATKFYGNALDGYFSPLTRREMEILRHIIRGYTNQEIARELTIQPQTVKNHLSSIFRKLNVRDRTQAAVFAVRHGWVRSD